MKLRRRGWLLPATLILLILAVAFIGAGKPYATVGYYQGIHPSFAGVKYNGVLYTEANPPEGASMCRVSGGNLNFDPDGKTTGKPNLCGEMSDFHIIMDPTVSNPYAVYEWKVDRGDGYVEVYRMELWLCRWEMNLFIIAHKGCGLECGFQGEQYGKRYSDTEVWIKLEATPSWYFEGAEESYFAIAAIEVKDWEITTGDPNKIQMHPITGALTIYNSLDGASEGTPDPQQEALKYKGTRLNPQVFGGPKYTMLTLDSFGVKDWWSGPWHGYETESVKYEFTVHVFVVGKWVVKKEHSEDFIPHPGIIEKTPWDKFWGDFFKLLGMANPFAMFGKYASLAAFIALCLVIIIIIAIISKIFSQRVRFEVYPPYPYRGGGRG